MKVLLKQVISGRGLNSTGGFFNSNYPQSGSALNFHRFCYTLLLQSRTMSHTKQNSKQNPKGLGPLSLTAVA